MIDTSTWKEFRVGDYFEVTYGTFKAKSESVDEGGTPHITTTQYNNGIGYYVKEQMFPAHCITVASDGCQGASFYHTYPISASNIVSVCVPHDDVPMNETIGNFLCSLFRKEGEKYSWGGFKYSVDIVRETRLHLPATSDGQPDWDYMESYMKAVMEESEKSLESLRKADDTKHLIDVSGWGEFDITELFDMSLPKGDLQVKKVDDGNIPLITPSNFNNGMLQRISEHSKSTLYDKGSLTVDMFGNAYYQEEDFFVTAHGHVNVLIPKMTLNVYTGTFLASTIRTMFFDKYGFNEMCTQKVLKAESIWLPITSTGEPDWQYMEDYMRIIMDKSEQIVSDLQIGA